MPVTVTHATAKGHGCTPRQMFTLSYTSKSQTLWCLRLASLTVSHSSHKEAPRPSTRGKEKGTRHRFTRTSGDSLAELYQSLSYFQGHPESGRPAGHSPAHSALVEQTAGRSCFFPEGSGIYSTPAATPAAIKLESSLWVARGRERSSSVAWAPGGHKGTTAQLSLGPLGNVVRTEGS